MKTELVKVKVEGHILVESFVNHEDLKNNKPEEVLLDIHNDIHPENMSSLIALAISRKGDYLSKMYFGNGGAVTDSLGNVTYFPTNKITQQASLYNTTYTKIIDAENTANSDPTNNFIDVNHVSGSTFTDLTVNCLLDYGEPSDQSSTDTNSGDDTNTNYNFNEIGLVDNLGYLVTHMVFAPIEKSLNRLIRIKYRLRITVL